MIYLRYILTGGLWLMYMASAYGQYDRKENNVWAFGDRAGLDFNGGVPQPVATAMQTVEGCASVCDEQGNLLFYTNGDTVWNRNHTAMPNGRGLSPGTQINSTTQAAVIIPVYDDPDRYYVFSLGASWYGGSLPAGSSILSYSVVDVSLAGGLGDVVPGMKNLPLDQDLSEKMIAIPGDDCNIWLLCQSRDARFKAWSVSPSGLNTTPVISAGGYAYPNPLTSQEHLAGVLKVSPDRRKLAGVYGDAARYYAQQNPQQQVPGIQLFDFDPATGIVSNAFTLTTDPGFYYGACFSPDNSRLYISVSLGGAAGIVLLQYDMNAGPLIAFSKLQIASMGAITDLRLAPDGKIYFPGSTPVLHRINQPNLRGTACGYESNAVVLPAGMDVSLGLPAQVMLYPVPDSVFLSNKTAYCYRDSQYLHAPPGTVRHLWNDGSRDSVLVVYDTGTYILQSRENCVFRLDTFRVTFPDTLGSQYDSFLCPGAGLTLQGPAGRDLYLWDDQGTASTRFVAAPGTYYLYSSHNCRPYSDTFTVRPVDLDFDLGPDTLICGSPPFRLSAWLPGAEYYWQDGSADSLFFAEGDGMYWVRVGKDGCVEYDSISLRFIPLAPELGNDTVICRGDKVMLGVNVTAGADIRWNNGAAGPSIFPEDSGTYVVTVSLESCTASDTVHIAYTICDCTVSLPDAFTPNGDGRNDLFRPVIEPGCPVRNYRLSVYNRWGQLVYSGNDPLTGWNGLHDGQPAETGTYMYYVSFDRGSRAYRQTLKGDLTLVR